MKLLAWIKRNSQFLDTFFKIICLIVLAGQCVRSALEYFQYSVYNKVASYTPMELAVPQLSLCIPVPALLDNKHGKEFFTSNENSAAGKTLGYFYSISPPANSTVLKCRYRDFETDRMVSLDRDGCYHFFKIKVYRLFGYVCYRFTPLPCNYTIYSVVSTFTHRRVLYDIVIDKPLNLGYKLLPMIHQDPFPTIDRLWDQELLPSNNLSETQAYALSQNVYEMHRLPPPYTTNCGPYSRRYCVIRCMQNALRPYGLSPIDSLPEFDHPSLLFPSTRITYKGKTLLQLVRMYESPCENLCKGRIKCDLKIVQTIISSPIDSQEKLVFAVETVSEPVTLSKTKASFTLIDFIFTCATLGSIWVGFSVLGLFDLGRSCLTHDAREKMLQQMMTKCEKTLAIKKQIECTLRRHSLFLSRTSHVDSENRGLHRYKPGTKKLIIAASLLVKLSLLIGFLWQTISISKTFFNFGTRTQLSFDLNPIVEPPTAAICVRYDVILGNNKSTSLTRDNYNQLFNRIDTLFDVTVGEMFNNSWSNEKLIHSCRIRRRSLNQSWIMQLHDREECKDYFTRTRFFFDRNICYTQKFLNATSWPQARQKQMVSDPGVFYSLVLSESAASGDKIFIMLYSNNQALPLESKEFAAVIYKTKVKRLFLISQILHQKESLPYPYEDRCDQTTSKAACRRLCFREKSLARLGRLPFSDIFSEDEVEQNSLADKKFLRYSDLNSTESMKIWTEIEKECYSKCKYNKCNLTVFNTLVNFGFRSEYKVELAVESHSSPDVIRRSIAQLTFFEYSYQFFATAAFWFAFTVLSVNPVAALVTNEAKSSKCLMKKLKRVKKTTAILRNMIISLNQLFGMRLMHHAMKRKKPSRWHDYLHWFVKKDASKYYYLLELLCAIGCVIHLSTAFNDYFSYPVTMKTLSDSEQLESRHHDFSLCLNTKGLLKLNHSLKLPSSTGFVRKEDDFPEISIKQIFESTPDARDLLVACGHRGLRKSPLKALTDRVYFTNFNDSELCNTIFPGEKFLLGANTCYKYGQKRGVDNSDIDPAHLINFQQNILTLMINSSYMTDEFLVTVSEQGDMPDSSDVWAPTITRKGPSVWMAFSYIKIIRNVLDPPYGNDGFTDSSLVGCMSKCLNIYFNRFGVRDAGLISKPPRDNSRYLSSSDLDEPVIRDLYQQYQDDCKNDCFDHNLHESERITTFITLLSEWKYEDDAIAAHKTQLILTRTEYPVMIITFLPKQSLPEFFIILGSILGIWFGLSAVHFDPLRYLRKDTTVSPNQLVRCETELELVSKTIHQFYYFFFACKN